MRNLTLLSTTLALCALLATGAAQAGRPLVTETADANAAGACDAETSLTRVSERDAPSLRLWETVVACGIGHDTQLGAGYARARSEGQTLQALSLGGKTNLVAPEDGRTGWGVAYGLDAAEAPGRSLRLETLGLAALATRELAPGLLGHANLGLTYNRVDRKTRAQWSLGLETAGDLVLAADIYGEDRGRPTVSAGAGWTFGGGVSANLSYAVELERPRVKALGLGLKLVF
ncbi:conserved exported hypothetical protein [Rubrivivax sp. A210]|uniref:hypothetical protein n=1 Tax=Rubrivivax sp. A210 TaxID=2772301 RepID=UPI0019193CD4|nr:hypothetical protein [Rubrivivax sp. A210]CAD5373758.1 conserved exported hypothetical protein [Rubrivivax sp. A210]